MRTINSSTLLTLKKRIKELQEYDPKNKLLTEFEISQEELKEFIKDATRMEELDSILIFEVPPTFVWTRERNTTIKKNDLWRVPKHIQHFESKSTVFSKYVEDNRMTGDDEVNGFDLLKAAMNPDNPAEAVTYKGYFLQTD